jgi:hypothetical protein
MSIGLFQLETNPMQVVVAPQWQSHDAGIHSDGHEIRLVLQCTDHRRLHALGSGLVAAGFDPMQHHSHSKLSWRTTGL